MNDRDLLASLVLAGKVKRRPVVRREHKAFVADIERRVQRLRASKSTVNLAIRPKRKKGRR